jgi:DNA polymerase elongation subunit (family B)
MANRLTLFYFLKCEYEDEKRLQHEIHKSTCTLRVYGKNETGDTIALELFHYEPDFFISFRNRDVCVRNIKRIKERLHRYMACISSSHNSDNNSLIECCHIKGIETATGYSSLIIFKDHQDASGGPEDYGDTRLSFTYRVSVRCFSHIRPAIREILECARETAVECGSYTGISLLEQDVHFYESSLDANVRVADKLELSPCQWCWLDTSVCTDVSVTTIQRTQKRILRLSYDFNRYVDSDILEREGKMKYTKMPFTRVSDELKNKLPPPVSLLSFDIECLANDINVFPTPDVCGIIQISTVIAPDALNRSEFNEAENAMHRCLYTVNDCDSLDDVKTTVKCFDTESEMLATFCSDLLSEDPDIITGYNIENFDFPFLFARLSFYNLNSVLGRLGLASVCNKNTKEKGGTKKYTSYTPKSNFTVINGRIVFDACVFMRKEFTLRSYTLNSVCEHFLKSRKDDVHYSQIPSLFNSGPHGRAVLGRYCMKDAQLVMDLAFHLQAFVTMYERCKVFNTTLDYLLDRGQQVRIIAMLLGWCSERNILINDCTTPNSVFYESAKTDMRQRLIDLNAVSTSRERNVKGVKRRIGNQNQQEEKEEEEEDGDDDDDNQDDEGEDKLVGNNNGNVNAEDGGGKTKNTHYDGAVVIEPKRGLYHDPVVCLDYASLYPSIMIAHNLCYSTMILNPKHGQDALEKGIAERSPVGHYFLKAENKKGALPSILETLITTRAEVRKRMYGLNQESLDYMLLNGQQGALKVAANSIYGATGCLNGKLYFLQIPSSVTAYGRVMITSTKEFIEKKYPDREVVYGDTDSVMVRLVGWTTDIKEKRYLWECVDAGAEMADSVTRLFDRRPIKLQFETVYLPFLLANKKRYAAGVYKSLDIVNSVAKKEGVQAAQNMLNDAKKNIICKGLEVVRRDNCLYAKNLLQNTIDMIMDLKRPQDIVDILRTKIFHLLRGDVNIRDLIISKEWSKKTKNPTPHDCLAQKMLQRNPGEAPQLGDRIQYIIIESADGRVRKMCDRAEDPLYVLEHGLKIDYIYYADKQLLNPLVNVLAIAMPESTKEEIKDMLWPSSSAEGIPERPGRKCGGPGNSKRPRKNTKHDIVPANNRLITSFFHRPSTSAVSKTSTDDSRELDEIEDICKRLQKECMSCKSGDEAATASCRNRDCPLLFERYTQKRRIASIGFAIQDKEYAKVLGLQ